MDTNDAKELYVKDMLTVDFNATITPRDGELLTRESVELALADKVKSELDKIEWEKPEPKPKPLWESYPDDWSLLGRRFRSSEHPSRGEYLVVVNPLQLGDRNHPKYMLVNVNSGRVWSVKSLLGDTPDGYWIEAKASSEKAPLWKRNPGSEALRGLRFERIDPASAYYGNTYIVVRNPLDQHGLTNCLVNLESGAFWSTNSLFGSTDMKGWRLVEGE